jgi:hypothetical protein
MGKRKREERGEESMGRGAQTIEKAICQLGPDKLRRLGIPR